MRLSLVLPTICVGFLTLMSSCSHEPIVLAYNLGSDFEERNAFNYDLAMEVPNPNTGGQTHMEMNMQFDLLAKGESAEEGNNKLQITYEKIAIENDVDAVKTTYNSETGENSMEEASAMFSALVNTPLNMDISSTGVMSNVSGFDVVAEKILNNLPQADTIDPETMSTMKNEIAQQFSIDQLQGQLGLNNINYPEHAVAVDSSWEFSNVQATSVPLLIEGTYTVVDISASTVTLKMDADVSMAPSAGPMAAMFETSGTQTGEIVVNKSTGWVESMTGDLNVLATFDSSAMGGGADAMELKIDASFSLTSE